MTLYHGPLGKAFGGVDSDLKFPAFKYTYPASAKLITHAAMHTTITCLNRYIQRHLGVRQLQHRGSHILDYNNIVHRMVRRL